MNGWDEYLANSDSYDWASFTLANGQNDYDLKANQSALFKNMVQARGIVMISDQNLSIKLNNTAYPKILVTTIEMPWEFLNKKIIKEAYLSNSSGQTANVEILLI